MRKIALVIPLVLVVAAGKSPGVWAEDLPMVSTVTAAEVEGSAFARGSPVASRFSAYDAGGAERKCVASLDPIKVAGQPSRLPSIRSGEFQIGGQLSPDAGLRAGLPAKIWWVPMHTPSMG